MNQAINSISSLNKYYTQPIDKKPICAIVAEYNPFHNGHLYQIEKTKEIIGDSYFIAIMSGNFTQRGEPAIMDKYSRAKSAIKSGIDMVIELPLVYACQSGDIFTEGAIKIIKALGIFDYISFGAECSNLDKLRDLASFFASPRLDYERALRNYLKNGYSFPKARSLALTETRSAEDAEIINSANNILAIDYLKYIELYGVDIIPIVIERVGSSHNDICLTENFSSGSAIRNKIFNIENEKGFKEILKEYFDIKSSIDELSQYLPIGTMEYLDVYFNELGRFIKNEDFFEIIKYKLITNVSNDLKEIFDLHEDIFNSIKSTSNYHSIEDLIENIKTKNFTRARIQRFLNNILLEIDNDIIKDAKSIDYPRYLNILAANKKSPELLSLISTRCDANSITPIYRSSDIKRFFARINLNQNLSRSATLLSKDLLASEIYELGLKCQQINKMDYKNKRIINIDK